MAAHLGTVVVTVTAGKPPPHPLTDWDRQCGFAESDDVVGARRAEDEAALAQLGSQAVWLDFLDRQYRDGEPPAQSGVARAIELILRDHAPEMIASPLGLSHPDHLVTAAACLDVARGKRAGTWVIYEDAIYRAIAGATDEALARLRHHRFALRPLEVLATARKGAAIVCYSSQLKGLGGLIRDAYRPERYWSVISEE